MQFFILTDIEGAAGVDRFVQTRTFDVRQKGSAMKQLGKEVNACIRGIRQACPDARIDVWDGHGRGGLFPEDIVGGTYMVKGRPYYDLRDCSAVLFVGQHAMAGTFQAPLNHTYSSLSIAYYKLNGVFIGEFAARALIAGLQGVPVIFISGDDKAVWEAQLFIPGIHACVTKQGTGIESAVHLDPDEACERIRRETEKAVRQMGEIAPFTAFSPPFTLEIRYCEPQQRNLWETSDTVEAVWVDERTVMLTSNDLQHFPM